jgi:hypothetical protein
MTAEELKKHFDDAIAALTASLVKRDEEIKNLGDVTAATKKQLTDAEGRFDAITAELAGAKKRADDLELKFGRPGMARGHGGERKSAADMFTESDEFKNMMTKNLLSCGAVPVGDGFSRKDLSGASGSAGMVVIPDIQATVIVPPQRQFYLRGLFGGQTTVSNLVEFICETGFANLFTTLAAAAAAGAQQITVASVAGLYRNQKLWVDVEGPFSISDVATDGSNVVSLNAPLVSAKVAGMSVVSNTYGPKAEGTDAPEMNITYDRQTVPVKTLSSWVPVTRQILLDAPQLNALINIKLAYGLKITEEEQFLYGDGTGESLLGVLNTPSIQHYAWSSGVKTDTKIDALRRAMTLARLAHYPVDGIILHPYDLESIELIKDTMGRYIWVNVNDGGVPRFWRVPALETEAIRPGTSLLGAFSLGAAVVDREQTTVRVSDSHSDFFVKGKMAILVEERLALKVERPEAFVEVAFDAPPSY